MTTRQVPAEGASSLERFLAAISQRHDFDAGLIEPADNPGMSSEQHRLPSGEDLRPAMGAFSLGQFRHRRGRTSGRGNPRQGAGAGQLRDEVAVLTPTAAAGVRGVAQGDRRAAFDRNLLQLSLREECDPLPVRRQEGSECPFRAREFRRLGLIEPSRKEPSLRNVNQSRAVGRGDYVASAGEPSDTSGPRSTSRRTSGRSAG